MLKVMNLVDKTENFRYGEHYNSNECYVVHDWNDLERELGHEKADQVERILGKLGFEQAYPDQMTICEDCYKLVDLMPGYYGDVHVAQILDDCTLLCPKCAISDPEAYIEDRLNNPKKANTLLTVQELADLGFSLVEGQYETGFHTGQTDDPKKILAKHKEVGKDYLFHISDIGQFDVRYSLYSRGKEDND